MKMKRILTYLLTFSLLFGLLPTAALAEGGGTPYEVSNADGLTTALSQIASSGAQKATIVLTADVTAEKRTASTETEKGLVGGTDPENAVIYGVPGCHITFQSKSGDSLHKITFSNGGYLVGNITFDNVNATFPRTGAIYANGFLFEITDNAGTVQFYDDMDLYGGSDRRAVDSTHLILKKATYASGNNNGANIYGGGKGSGTGGSTMKIDGSGPYTLAAPAAGDVKGDVVIELGDAAFSWVVGGGKDANVGGNVTITYDGNGTLGYNNAWISVITGAGHSENAGYGHVAGNVTIHANSGHVMCIYGTGWVGGHGTTEDDSIAVGRARSVGGNVTITLGTDSAEAAKALQLGQFGNVSVIACGTTPAYYGWSTTRAAVGGDIQITVNKSTLFQTLSSSGGELNVVGVGINSVCHGTVTMTNNGGRDNYYYSGETWNMYACYTSGKILNTANETRAVSIYQNDGKLSYIQAVEHKDFSTVSSTTGKPAEIKGDVYTEVNGGTITAVYGRSYDTTDVKINGNYIVKVTGGVMDYIYGATVGRELTTGHASTLTFDGYPDVDYLYRVGYLDDVTLMNNSTVRLTGSTTYSYQPFYSETVKNLTVDTGSTLGLKKNGSLTGNLTVNGTLALARTNNVDDATLPGTTVTITAAGTATGTGTLRPVSSDSFDTSLENSTPVYLEEYVYAPAAGSNLTLALSPAVAGLSVNRKATDTAGTDVWFIDKLPSWSVSYELDGGTGADGVDYSMVSVPQGESVTIKAAPSKSGCTFTGWSDGTTVYQPGAELTVKSNITLTAQWSKNPSGDGSGSSDSDRDSGYTLRLTKLDAADDTPLGGAKFELWRVGKKSDAKVGTYTTNRFGWTQASVSSSGDYYWIEITPPEGYQLDESKYPTDTGKNKSITVYNSKTSTPVLLTDDHFAYVIGMPDGTVRPEANITRAEVATIFFRLLREDVREKNMSASNPFPDVTEGAWYNHAVSTLWQMGILKGSDDGKFHPNDSITRAEFAAIAARFSDTKVTGATAAFNDIANHWARDEINYAAALGWVNGWTDGGFHTDVAITRAEAMTLVNRVLNRNPRSKDALLGGMVEWPDNADTSKWYYLAVQEATNSHDYERDGSYEMWTKLQTVRDWSALEK